MNRDKLGSNLLLLTTSIIWGAGFVAQEMGSDHLGPNAFNGVRYSIPGDFCTVEEDGTLTLLGRGSVCINTGGEKVYPEEVEEALKTHPAVEDALVVGLPDEKWGQAITGIIKLADGQSPDEASLIAHVKDHLAHYKAPKRVLVAANAFRAPNGKADYKGATSFAKQELGVAS